MLTKKQCKSQRKISQESAFPPHGRMESCNGCELLFRQYRGAHGNWQDFGSANAWGKWTSTALDVESNVASPLDEPGTPCILCRGVSDECIILDACCIINLYASRHFGHILEALPTSVAVTTYVREKEALKIYGGPDEHVMQRIEQIDLQPFIDRGLLTAVLPESEAENVTYVNFAASLDDGEAITGAIAVHRNWAIGSDDRRALSFFAKAAPHLQMLSTLELMKQWVDTTDVPADIVHAALRNVRTRAKYEPHSKHPLHHWWRTYLENSYPSGDKSL